MQTPMLSQSSTCPGVNIRSFCGIMTQLILSRRYRISSEWKWSSAGNSFKSVLGVVR